MLSWSPGFKIFCMFGSHPECSRRQNLGWLRARPAPSLLCFGSSWGSGFGDRYLTFRSSQGGVSGGRGFPQCFEYSVMKLEASSKLWKQKENKDHDDTGVTDPAV